MTLPYRILVPVDQSGSFLGAQNGTIVPPSGSGLFYLGVDQNNIARLLSVIQSGSFGILQVTGTVLAVPTGNQQITGTVLANQGSANTLANAWTYKITDGINGPMAVKPSGTVPVIGDPAGVVVISPNQQQIPVSSTPLNTTPGIAIGYINTSAITNVPVRATTYTQQTTNFTGSIASSAAADASGSTGAFNVIITYLDQNYTGPYTTILNLSGTTGNNFLTGNLCYIEKMEVINVGSGQSNAGIITLYSGLNKGGTVVGSIAVGDNRTFWGHHYIPTGKTSNITGLTGFNNNSNNQTVFIIQTIMLNTTNAVSEQISDWTTGYQNNQSFRLYSSPIKISGPALLILYAQPGGSPNIKSQGSFDFYDQ